MERFDGRAIGEVDGEVVGGCHSRGLRGQRGCRPCRWRLFLLPPNITQGHSLNSLMTFVARRPVTRCCRVLGGKLLVGARDLSMGRRLLGCRRPRYAAWNTAFGWPFVRDDRQAET